MTTRTTAKNRPTLSRDRVLQTALAIADADGLKAVTMRGVAGELKVEAMSLYYHLPGKAALSEGLVELVLEEVLAQIDTDLTQLDDPTWTAAVRARCLAARQVMLRHPWAPGLMAQQSGMPVPALRLFEGVLAEMSAGGVNYHLGHRGLHALGSMILGFVQEVFQPPQVDGEFDEAHAQAELAQAAALVPHLAAMVAHEIHANRDQTLGWCDDQTEFEFTLDLLLDGLARAAGDDAG